MVWYGTYGICFDPGGVVSTNCKILHYSYHTVSCEHSIIHLLWCVSVCKRDRRKIKVLTVQIKSPKFNATEATPSQHLLAPSLLVSSVSLTVNCALLLRYHTVQVSPRVGFLR